MSVVDENGGDGCCCYCDDVRAHGCFRDVDSKNDGVDQKNDDDDRSSLEYTVFTKMKNEKRDNSFQLELLRTVVGTTW